MIAVLTRLVVHIPHGDVAHVTDESLVSDVGVHFFVSALHLPPTVLRQVDHAVHHVIFLGDALEHAFDVEFADAQDPNCGE